MGKSVTGLLLVLGGAVAGIVGFGILYGIAAAVIGLSEPIARGTMFGLTFGLFSGVGVAVAGLERFLNDLSRVQMIAPATLAVVLALLAIAMLFTGGAWSKIFGGGGVVFLVVWGVLSGWLGKVVGGAK